MRTLHPMQCFVGPHGFVYILHHASWLGKTPHFGGCAPQRWAKTPKFELGQDFCTMHLPSKFHHPMLTCSEVIVLTHKPTNPATNKQIPAKTSNVRRYATTLGNDYKCNTSLTWGHNINWHANFYCVTCLHSRPICHCNSVCVSVMMVTSLKAS